MRRVLAILVVVVPLTAHATPNMFGIGVGVANDVGFDDTAVQTLSAFGRFGLTHRLGLQAELARGDADENGVGDRTFTVLATFDLVDTGRLVPLVLGGVGYDWSSDDAGGSTGEHVEAGIGLEYRFDGGLALGIDLRAGERFTNAPGQGAIPVGALPGDDIATMTSGDYRSARMYAGLHF